MAPRDLQPARVLVGRDQQRKELRQLWAEVCGGRGQIVAVSGDAGIGKTHLVEDLTAYVRATDDEATVAWGSCTGPNAPALWPWRAIWRAIGVDTSTEVWTLPDATDTNAGTGIQEAIVETLRDRFTTPGVVVIDDLHWADLDSLAALRLCVGELRDLPILLIVTLRPDEQSGTAPELRRVLVDLAAAIHTLHLRGLPATAVREMISAQIGGPVSDELAEEIHDRAGANPLLVRELVRLMQAESDLLDVDELRRIPLPPLMRDILLSRVDLLDPAARRMLEVAAVAGRDVALASVADAADCPFDEVVRAAEAAAAEDLVSVDGVILRFSHDLLREALVDHLAVTDRQQLHARVADSLTRHGGPGSDLSEIAGHLCAAMPLVSGARVAEASLKAGRDSLARHAPVAAADQLRRGLDAADADPLATELYLELGTALARAGERPESLDAFDAAAASARSHGDSDGLARAAVGEAAMSARPRTDPGLVALLEEALSARAGRRDALTAEVMRSLAHSLLFSDQLERRLRLSDQAIDIAREVGDPHALAHALYVWLLVHESSTNFDDRVARADELLAVARTTGSGEIEASALHHHARQMAELGDYVTYDADVAACDATAQEVASVPWQWTALLNRAMRAVMTGDFVEGERLGDEAFGIGSRAGFEAAAATYGAHLMALRTWQGRLGEMLPIAVASAGEFRELPAVWAAVPYIRAETGELDQARSDLMSLVADERMRALPGSQSWAVAVAMLSRVAHLTGSAQAAEALLPMLQPIGARHIVGPYADCYFGPASLYRGLCRVAVGDLDAAAAELRDAVRSASQVGATPVAAWAAGELVVTERRRGGRGLDRQLDSALSSLRRLEMPTHVTRLREAFGQAARPVENGPRASPGRQPTADNRFTFTDDRWTINFNGTSIQIDDMKGIRDLHQLISRSGDEIHALELMGADGESIADVSTQPVLDDEAKRAYRRRLSEIELEIDDADRCADLARAERAHLEREALYDQLRAATGLGGRDRALPAEHERARQAVRARIRYALDKIESVDGELGRHLRHAVTTGTHCVYQPERPTRWET